MNGFRIAIIAALVSLLAVGSMLIDTDAEVLKTQSMKQIEMLNQ